MVSGTKQQEKEKHGCHDDRKDPVLREHSRIKKNLFICLFVCLFVCFWSQKSVESRDIFELIGL